MNIENFTPKHLGEIRNFCIEELAGILYRCVEHPEPRKDVDWLTSETWIDQNTAGILNDLTKKFLFLTCYQELKKDGFSFPETANDCFGFVSSDELKRIVNQLSILKDEKVSDLIDGLKREERRKYHKELIGRDVWNLFYQNIKQDNYINPENSFLKSKGYTKIIFG